MARKQTYEELEKRIKELEKQREKVYIHHRSALVDPDGGEP